ncbi:DUF4291 domain-containing protein [Streptomyces yaizuensis]|uniref:DUF4291 domain-containing protein n=1 Tax=Streptomyces yaizuensis TaxID=2989713 RepID=A0ABQ5NWX4_9ACTN|nr:DUF4291 domain-containing protein [Streptomyces sp. YSPA8]GLF94877.1 DUF4291 domain-containing protein [Streptomyces sp. YSPA8]
MTALRQIRAQHDARTIVVYQAYSSAIADPALREGRFVPPFSFQRMTWIKPSFLWLMHRSNWGQKSGQERILAIRVTREGWEEALSQAVLTTSHPDLVAKAPVHVQWDPERSLRGAALNHYSIQVGIGRGLIKRYAEEWVTGLEDITPQVRKIAQQVRNGKAANAQRLLPPERLYTLPRELAGRLDIDV